MQLDTARELKKSLTDNVLSTLITPIQSRALGISARPIESTLGGPATVALGIARKSKRDFMLAVRIQHRALENSAHVEIIRKQAKGEVDVRYIGRVTKRAGGQRKARLQLAPCTLRWHQTRNRPLLVGGSVGHFKITAGTLGCFVRERSTSPVFILSNNHVLADENRAAPGDSILQPGPFDQGKKSADTIGTLARFVKLKRLSTNQVDCAIALVNDGLNYNYKQLTGIGELAGLGEGLLDSGTRVAKVGRTTGVTRGKVTAFEIDNVVVAYDMGELRFDGQIEIEGTEDTPFSQGGDSGSLIVNDDGEGVALLFAGGDQGGSKGLGLTYAHPLQSVLEKLTVRLLY